MRNRASFWFPVAVAAALVSVPASAAEWTIDPDDPFGGDCFAIGGNWFDALDTCTLTNRTILADDSLTVLSGATLEAFQQFTNLGSIDIQGGFTVQRFENLGTLSALEVSISVGFEIVNHGSIDIERGELIVEASGEFRNWGFIENTNAEIGLRCHPIPSDGENHGTIYGGRVWGCAYGDGPTRFVNGVDGTLERNTGFSGMDFLNQGTIVVQGGSVGGGLPFTNHGVLEFRGSDFITDETIVNAEDGVLLSSADVENRGALVNNGLWVNMGRFENYTSPDSPSSLGSVVNHGLILDHSFGRLGWTGSLADGQSPPLPVNFGVISHYMTPDTGLDISNQGTVHRCNETARDLDGDLVCDVVDCAMGDSSVWSSRLARNLTIEPTSDGQVQLRWEDPLYLGGSAIDYDVLSSLDPTDFADPMNCTVASVGGNTAWDASSAPPGATRHYLVSAIGCDSGTAGQDSAGIDRVVADCP